MNSTPYCWVGFHRAIYIASYLIAQLFHAVAVYSIESVSLRMSITKYFYHVDSYVTVSVKTLHVNIFYIAPQKAPQQAINLVGSCITPGKS